MKTNVETGLKTKNHFRENLKYFRSEEKISQADLSKETGINQKTIGAYEEGRATPKPDALIILADYFGIRVDELIRNRSGKLSIREYNPVS